MPKKTFTSLSKDKAVISCYNVNIVERDVPFMKKRLPLFLLLFLVSGVLWGVFTHLPDTQDADKETVAEPPTEETFTITAVGDIMMHNTQIKAGYQNKNNTYDFSSFFSAVKPFFQDSDLVIGNLETTLGNNPQEYGGYPRFNTPAILAQNLKEAGFHLLSTANNHCMDKGVKVLSQTLDYLDEAALLHVGTNRSPEERDTILYTEIKGVKIAILAYTYGTNGLNPPRGHEYAVNYIDEARVITDMEKARQDGAQLIILYLHFGEEYREYPDNNQIYLANTFFRAGADIILGSHAHVLQGSEIYYTEDGKKQFIIYSLGNFISDQIGLARKSSLLLHLHFGIEASSGEPYFQEASYVPLWTRKWRENGKTHFQIIPLEQTLAQIRMAETGDFTYPEIQEIQQAWLHILPYTETRS